MPLPTIPTWIDIPETSRAVLLGLRDELEAVGFCVGLQMGSPSWAERYRHGVTIYDADVCHRHLANAYLHGGEITLLKSGEMPAWVAWQGGKSVFDLNDPQSIPGIVAAVQKLRFGLPNGEN